MTDQEIIKALEWCEEFENNLIIKGKGDKKCVLALQMTVIIRSALENYTRQQAEIERLRAKNQCFPDLGITYSEIRAEAVREFAEKLKANARKGAWEVKEYIEPDDIDYLVEEMVGEQ